MTRFVRFANNATSKLAANLSAVGLTISLTPGDGNKFPSLTGNQFFTGTLVKADGTKEIVKVTAKTTDTLTITRAFEAVGGVQTAYPFSAGDKFELRLTAEALSNELDRLDAAAFLEVMNKSANYTIVEADVSKLIKTDTGSGNITHTLPLISFLTGSFEVQVCKSTVDTNTVTVVRSGADTINGINSYNLSSQYQCVWLVADLATNTWTAVTSASATNAVVDQFIGAGTAGPFTLTGLPGTKNNTLVHVGGVYQNKATYTLTGNQLTLGGTVSAGVIVECTWSQPVAIGTPSDGTVSPIKLTQATIGGEYATIGSIAGTNTITGTITGIASYAPGQTFRFIAAASNTGAVTINLNALGAKAITKSGSTPLEAGDIAIGASIQIVYDGTQFQLTSGAGGGAKAGGVIYENNTTLTSNYTLSAGKNGMMAGPLTVNSGVVLTIPSGRRLVIL